MIDDGAPLVESAPGHFSACFFHDRIAA